MSVVPITAAQVVESTTPSNSPAVAEAPPVAPAQDPKVAQHFAALARKERLIHREREALKAEKAQLAAERTRVAEIEAKYGSRPSTPREALQRYGYDYKQATEFELNDGAPTAEFLARQAQEQVQQLRQEQADRDRLQAENQAKKAIADKEEIVREFKSEIQEYVTEKAEEFELIAFHDAYEVVYHTVEEHYTKTGKLLSIPEAANMVEKYLEDRLDKIQSTKKFAKKRTASESPVPETGFGRQSEVTAQRRTLDNSLQSSTSPTLVKSPQVESDRMRRALAALSK